MKYIRRAKDRGLANHGWLKSKHSFSFANYHDPKHMGISALRVINDDTVSPGQGFSTHGHQNMEIISYVIKGALQHEDSEGNKHIVPAGDVQRMSAGTGVRHSEYNASNTEPVSFLQIWIQPNKLGVKPSYQQKTIQQKGALTPLVTANGRNGSLSMNQNASLSRLTLSTDETITLIPEKQIGYLHIIKGEIMVDNTYFEAGDAFAIDPAEKINLKALSEIEALWFELPAKY